jgi:ABC-2 type transport system ATP-binding protein
MNSLKIKNLQKTYPNGVKALDDISLEISNGMFGLLGPNGAGKSSLMKTIAGLQTADGGQILFNEVDVIQNPLFIKQNLGFLPQDFGVYPKISAYDLLNHIAILKGIIQPNERKEQVNELLEKVNLYAHRKREVNTFSGGMRQRFGIAQALLGSPKIIIVDEPTAGLDPEERNRFNGLLSEIGENIIVILSTHLVEDVKMLCTEMAVMNQGKILVKGKPTDFVENLKGKLWVKAIEKSQMIDYEQNFNVISKQYSMGKLSVTVLAESNHERGFATHEPTLEDAYFATLNHVSKP